MNIALRLSPRLSPTARSLAALALAAAAAAPALAASALQPFQATYEATALGMQGTGQMNLTRQADGRWQYTLSVRNQVVNLQQSTTFDEKNGQLRPLASNDVSALLIKRKAVQANYDWGKGQATWSGDVKPERAGPVPLQPGDMDALLVNLAIVRDVAAGRPLNYRMVENGKARQMSYQVAGKETITVAGEQKTATKITRSDGNKQVTAWIVPGMPVPARIVQSDSDGEIQLALTSVN
ncbi:MAG: DUF3108 domain-containing protein [Pseudoxanthomonas sp.]